MKLHILALLALGLGCSASSHQSQCPTVPIEKVETPQIVWRHINEATMYEARSKKRLVIVTFLSGNLESQAMSKKTLQDPRVVKAMNERFVPVLVDSKKHVEIANKLGLDHTWPQTVVVAYDGDPIVALSGFIAPDTYVELLKRLTDTMDEVKKPEPPPTKVHAL